MSIEIKRISVKNCGPIKEFNNDLRKLNLIYGKNETGKSFLVEFIIHCLFKNKEAWGYLREVEGEGKIVISGLEVEDTEFTLKKRKKLEEFLESQEVSPSLVKLLVVKGGEPEIVKEKKSEKGKEFERSLLAGIDKDTIKEILFPTKIIDSIDNQIPETVKKASIKDNVLDIEKKGDGENYYKKKEALDDVGRKIEEVVEKYEQGEIKDLEKRKKELEKKKEMMLKAKKYKAYRLSEEIKKLPKKEEIENLEKLCEEYSHKQKKLEDINEKLKEYEKEISKFPSDLESQYKKLLKAKKYKAYCLAKEIEGINKELEKISSEELGGFLKTIENYKKEKIKKNNIEKEIKELEEKSKDYYWLQTAEKNYKVLPSGKILLFCSPIFFIGSILMILLNKITFGILFLLSGFITLGGYLILGKKIKENENIKKEFQRRFNKPLNSLTDLQSCLREQEGFLTEKKNKELVLQDCNAEIENLKNQIEKTFESLGIGKIEESKWEEELNKFIKNRNTLKREQEEKKEELIKLGVDESEYEKTDPGVEFNEKEFKKVEKEVDELEKLKQKEEEKEKEKKEIEEELNKLGNTIIEGFKKIIPTEVPESNKWKDTLKELETKRTKMEGELQGLDISEEEYVKEDPGIEFQQKKLNEIEKELEKVDEELEEKGGSLEKLRSELYKYTDKDFSTDWDELINDLYSQKEKRRKELEEIEAKIIAGIKLYEVIKEWREKEDKELLKGLNSSEVKGFLKKLTKYNEFKFEDKEDIKISDEFNTLSLKDLSTSEKERVMLALRIGFAKRILKQDSAFLILDDAFQHCDRENRSILVETLFEIVKEGWQVICLTMDDNIRAIFKEKKDKGEIEGKDFQEITLE